VRTSFCKALPGKLFVAAGVFLCAGISFPGRADILAGSDQGLAAMMSAAENDMIFLGLQYGQSAQPVAFASQFSASSFQYTANSGSIYNGLPLVLTSAGASTGLDPWTTSAAGAVGGAGFTGSGTGTFSGNSIPEGYVSSGSEGNWIWFKTVSWSVDPFDPGLLHSNTQITFITTDPKTGQLVTKVVQESDERRRFVDDNGTWQISIDGIFGLNGPPVLIQGAFAANGAGSFTAFVAPEPATFFFTLVGASVFFLIWRTRLLRNRRPDRDMSRCLRL